MKKGLEHSIIIYRFKLAILNIKII